MMRVVTDPLNSSQTSIKKRMFISGAFSNPSDKVTLQNEHLPTDSDYFRSDSKIPVSKSVTMGSLKKVNANALKNYASANKFSTINISEITRNENL